MSADSNWEGSSRWLQGWRRDAATALGTAVSLWVCACSWVWEVARGEGRYYRYMVSYGNSDFHPQTIWVLALCCYPMEQTPMPRTVREWQVSSEPNNRTSVRRSSQPASINPHLGSSASAGPQTLSSLPVWTYWVPSLQTKGTWWHHCLWNNDDVIGHSCYECHCWLVAKSYRLLKWLLLSWLLCKSWLVRVVLDCLIIPFRDSWSWFCKGSRDKSFATPL